jgi:hypothetical protein
MPARAAQPRGIGGASHRQIQIGIQPRHGRLASWATPAISIPPGGPAKVIPVLRRLIVLAVHHGGRLDQRLSTRVVRGCDACLLLRIPV